MLTRYYDGFRSPAFDLFDSFKFLDDVATIQRSKSDTIDETGIKIEMPGVKQSDLEVTVEGRTLRISGKSRHGKEFSYAYSLKSSVDDSAIQAKLQDGLLEITLPKKAETKARKIQVT